MFIVESYGLAVALCWVTMLCWGSWGNTQKLAAKTWRYELFLLGLRDWHRSFLSDLGIDFRQHGRGRARIYTGLVASESGELLECFPGWCDIQCF